MSAKWPSGNVPTALAHRRIFNVVLEADASGAETARNVYGTNLVKRIIDDKEYNFFYNGQADVTALIDTATGAIAAAYYYDAFGVVLESTGTLYQQVRRVQLRVIENPCS